MPDEANCSRDIQRCGPRSYLELMIAREGSSLRAEIGHSEELRREAERRAAEALRLQAQEYERRLDALNNEHARLDKAQETYVSRETYELNLKTEREARQLLANQLAEGKGARDRTMLIFGVILSLATLALRFLPL